MKNTTSETKRIDWMITLVPLLLIVGLCVIFMILPEQAGAVLSQIRFFFGDTFGVYYLIIGLGMLIVSIYIAASKYGNIVLGKPDEKPKYSFFVWGSMMFTAGLAADILFYSFSEWVMYAADPHLAEMGSIQDWAGVFPIFHWSLVPWAFYLVLAAAFGYMLHVRGDHPLELRGECLRTDFHVSKDEKDLRSRRFRERRLLRNGSGRNIFQGD